MVEPKIIFEAPKKVFLMVIYCPEEFIYVKYWLKLQKNKSIYINSIRHLGKICIL